MKAKYSTGKAILILFTLATYTSCNHSSPKITQPTFLSLECSYDGGWADNGVFSIKIDSLGRFLLSTNRWEPHQFYQGKLSQTDLSTLFLKVKDTQLDKLQPVYMVDETPDMHSYNIWVTDLTNRLHKVQAYGDSVPAKLVSLQQVICLIRDTVSLHPVDHKILFASRKRLYPDPPTVIKFTPPPVENEAR